MKYPRAKKREEHQKLFRSFISSRNPNNTTFYFPKHYSNAKAPLTNLGWWRMI